MVKAQYEIKADCFGYSQGGCAVLTEALCATCGRCSFYKTREQAKADAERAHTAAAERGITPKVASIHRRIGGRYDNRQYISAAATAAAGAAAEKPAGGFRTMWVAY